MEDIDAGGRGRRKERIAPASMATAQRWRAEGLYWKLVYAEFTRFEDFLGGHCRIGFLKAVASALVSKSVVSAYERLRLAEGRQSALLP